MSLIPEKKIDVTSVGLMLLMIITIPFEAKMNARVIIAFSAFSIWLSIKHRNYSASAFPFAGTLLVFPTVFLLGFLNTSNLNSALRLLEARFSLIAFPVLLLVAGARWTRQSISISLLGFAIIIIACGLVIQLSLVGDLVCQDQPLSLFFYWKFSGANLSERIGLHPTYLSMYAIFSMGILHEFLIANRTFDLKYVLGITGIFYLVFLTIHLSSRISLVCMLVVLGLLLIKEFRDVKKSGPAILVIVGALMGLLVFSGSSIKSRFENNLGLSFSLLTGDTVPTDNLHFDQRTFAWYSAAQLMKENALFGVGSGDVDDELHDYYLKLNVPGLAEEKLNTHNQFFDAVVRNGVLGLLSLIILYFCGVYRNRRNTLYLIFTIIVVIFSLTENILDRQKGTVFFGVFSVLVYTYGKLRSDVQTSSLNNDQE